jgi:hypothetical protein
MQNWGLLILMIGIAAVNLPSVMQQWRTDRQGFIKTLWLMAAYALYFGWASRFSCCSPRAKQAKLEHCCLPASWSDISCMAGSR